MIRETNKQNQLLHFACKHQDDTFGLISALSGFHTGYFLDGGGGGEMYIKGACTHHMSVHLLGFCKF